MSFIKFFRNKVNEIKFLPHLKTGTVDNVTALDGQEPSNISKMQP